MAQGDLLIFQEAPAYLMDGDFASTDEIWVALVTNTPTPAEGSPVPGMGVSATTTFTEIAATGEYVDGGLFLDTVANMITWSGAITTFDDTGASVTWAKNAASPTTAVWAIIYNKNDTAGTLERAIAFIDLNGGTAVDMTAGDLTITWHATGIFTATIV